MNYDVAGFVLALAAAVRVFAPDVRSLVRRLLGAGVRVGAESLVDQQQRPHLPQARSAAPPSLDEGGV